MCFWNGNALLTFQPFHYVLSGMLTDQYLLLTTAMQLVEQNQPYAAWRLLDRIERINPNLPIELSLLRAKTLESCNQLVEALATATKAYQSAPHRTEAADYLLRLHLSLLPAYSEAAVKLAWQTLHQKRDLQETVVALQVFKHLQLSPVGVCHYDGSLITGWMLDSTSLPALTVTIDGSDFKLTPYLATPVLHTQGFGSGHDGFSLRVPTDQFKSIRIHLNGLDLVGSPICLETPRSSADALSLPCPSPSKLAASPSQYPVVDIIVPVYKGLHETKLCLNAVLNSRNQTAYRLIVIDDASPEPLLVDFLLDLHANGLIELIRQPINTGFVGAVNCGLGLSTSRDVILLNADTCVHGNWLDRLHAVAYETETIGTVTPLSNNGELVSFPIPMQISAMPEPDVLKKLDNDCALLGSSSWVEIPTGVGFCLYIKRTCLNDTGFLDDRLIERGYGDDTDLCVRATLHGWKNVCAPNVFVAHAGNVSFGIEKQTLAAKNNRRIHERYPKHEDEFDAFMVALPLAPVYDYLQRSIMPVYTAKPTKLVVLPAILSDRVSHEYIKAYQKNSTQNIYYLAITQSDKSTYRLSLTSNNITEPVHLDYTWPVDDGLLWQDLHNASFKGIEIHTLYTWPLPLINGLTALNVPYQLVLHDYSAYCLQNKLLKSAQQLCDDALDDTTCLACVNAHGSKNTWYAHPDTLRKASEQLFKGADIIRLASAEALQRHRAHFPEAPFQIDQSHVGNASPLSADSPSITLAKNNEILRIAVFFAATPDQGFFKLLELSRILASKRINIELVVFGETWDDNAILASGKAWLAGPVAWEDIPRLLILHDCRLVLQLALWPEVDGLAKLLARQCGLSLAAPLLGVYAELGDSNPSDIKLLPKATVSDWLQAILLANGMSTTI